MKMLKKMTPLMMATMMLAPSVLIQDVSAQDRPTRPSRDRGNNDRQPDRGTGRGEPTQPNTNSNSSQIVQLKEFDNYFKPYIGNLSFKLEDDSEVKAAQQQFVQQDKTFNEAAKVLKQKKDALDSSKKKQDQIKAEIEKIEKAIVAALTEKTNLEKQLPNLKKQRNWSA